MYTLTSAELALWQHPYPQKCTITGENITLTESDIFAGGFVIDRKSVSGSKIEIGSVIAAEIALTVDNHDGRFDSVRFEGESVAVSVSTKASADSTACIVPIGYFVFDSCVRNMTKLSIVGYDRMMQFDRAYENDINMPNTPAGIVEACCTKCDVVCGISDFSGFSNYNASISVTDIANGQTVTYRQILSWALEIMGVCGWCDWSGQFVCGWYSSPTGNTLTINESNRMSSGLGDEVRVTGVQIDDVVYLTESGTDEYLINIEGNSLITDDNRDSIGAGLATALTGWGYYIASASIKSAPHVWPMDMLQFAKGSASYTIAVTGMRFKLNGNTAIASDGETAVAESYASANPLTKAESAIIKRIDMQASRLGRRVTELSRVNDLASNALGFHTTLEEQEDGSYIEYTHDKATLAESTVIYKKTADGFFLSQDGGATYSSGFDSEGNAYLNILSVAGIKANWMTAGELKSQDGTSFYLNLDTGEFRAGASNVLVNGQPLGDTINDLSGNTDDALARLNAMSDYISYVSGVLTLGDISSNVKLTLENDGLKFVNAQTGDIIAYFTNDKLHTYDGIDVGNDWEITTDNGFSIRWKGDD